MENILEHVLKIIKYFEVKAQVKTEKKRRWFLSKQYLQSFDEPDTVENDALDTEDLHPSYKKRVKSMYRAAKYGMQEGVLTGVFVGGCWGIYKYVAENFSFVILSSIREGTEDETNDSRNESSQEKARVTSKKSITYDLENKTSDRSRTASGNPRSGSVRTNDSGGSKGVRPNTVGTVNQSRYSFKSREKVEIVGYAFIQTTGSVGAGSSSDSLKSEDSYQAKPARSAHKEESNVSKKSRSSSKNKSGDNEKIKTPSKTAKRGSNEGSITSTGKTKSAMSSRDSKNLKSGGKSKSKVAGSSKDPQSPEKLPSRPDVSRHTEKTESHPKSPEHNAFVKMSNVLFSKHARSSPGVAKNESTHSPSEVKSHSSKASNKSETRSKKSSPEEQAAKPTDSVFENVIPDPENSPSILVDEDQISNGYTSGVISSVHQMSNEQSRSAVMSARFSSNPVTEPDHNPDFGYSVSNISEIGAAEHSGSHTSEGIPPDDNKSLYSQPSTERGRSRTSGLTVERQRSRISEPAYHTSNPERTSDEECTDYQRTSRTEEYEQEPETRYSRYGSMQKSNSSFVKNIASASTDNARSYTSRSGGQDNKSAADEAGGFSLLSAVNDNIIVFSACNCAIVLGVVCTVISTTRASLSI